MAGPTECPRFVELTLCHVVVDPLLAALFFFVESRVGQLLVLPGAKGRLPASVAGDHRQRHGRKHEPNDTDQHEGERVNLGADVATAECGIPVAIVLWCRDGAGDLPADTNLDARVIRARIGVI